jgi:hypothetical protein
VNDGGKCPQAVNIAGNVSSGGVTVTGNRIHAGTCGSSAVNAGACESDGGPNGVSTFQNNLLFGTPTAFLREGCSPGLIETTLAAMEATLAAAGATAGNNVTLAESCVGIDGGTSECVPLACAADGGSCLDTVFAGWDDSSGGAANLFSDAGFAGTPPCAVVHAERRRRRGGQR